MPSDDFAQRLLDLYRTHPQNSANVLDRLAAQGVDLEHITPLDLACDPLTGMTDQNHPGGLGMTRQLAQDAKIRETDRVIDVGSGIGGTARILAYEQGCSVHGVELSPERHSEALGLTALVGLDHLVTFSCGDFFEIDLPQRQFDVAVGQATFAHFDNLVAALNRCADVMTPAARIAIEDSSIRRQTKGQGERDDLEALGRTWLAHFATDAEWESVFEQAGFRVVLWRDLTATLVEYYSMLDQQVAETELGAETAFERQGWQSAVRLASNGVLGYCRIVAERS